MDLVVYDDDEKRYVPWAVALVAVLLVALLTAGLTFLLARQAAGSQEQPISSIGAPQPATAPSAGASEQQSPSPVSPPPPTTRSESPSQACVAALEQADAAVRQALGVEQALADHTAIMDELLAERITAEQALDQTLPVLTSGATERGRLEEAVAAYQATRADCPV